MGIAAVGSPVDQRPERAGGLRLDRLPIEKPRASSKQNPPAQLQPIDRPLAPRKRFQKGQPGILELRQIRASHVARQELTNNGQQSWLGGRLFAPIQFFEPLAPPGEPDRAKVGVGAGRDHIGEREIEVPKCLECGANARGELLKRDPAVEIERALSDR